MIRAAGVDGPVASISVDLDTLRFYRAIHGLSAAEPDSKEDPAYRVGTARMLEFFDSCGIVSTLFVIGEDLRVPGHRSLLEQAGHCGHELANHSYSHYYDLRQRPVLVQRDEVMRADEAIAEVWGRRPVGFRAPGYNIAEDLLEILIESDYRYDASIFPCPPYYAAKAAIMAWLKLRGRPSRSAMGPVENLLAPVGPYRPALPAYWKGNAHGPGLWEIPIAVVPLLRFPLIGTSLHLLGPTGFDALFGAIARAYPEMFNLEFHAIDFMDSNDDGVEDLVGVQPDLAIPWTRKRDLYAHVFNRLRERYRIATMIDAVDSLAGR
jgi:peptidoglycan-N-acetylglucosamine deacetylase